MTSDSAKWLEIAKAYDTPIGKRTYRQKDITYSGLCNAGEVMGMSYWTASSLLRGMGWGRDGEATGFAFRIGGKQSDGLRCMYAALFAAMTDKEREEIGL